MIEDRLLAKVLCVLGLLGMGTSLVTLHQGILWTGAMVYLFSLMAFMLGLYILPRHQKK